MSSGLKRPLSLAAADAEKFRDLFANCFERWEIAGSVRRRKPEVGDVEHVVIPKWIDVPGKDLFATPTLTNAICQRSDELVASGMVSKHVYGATGTRWGERYRGFDFKGYQHEIYMTVPESWGAQLAIRTGPSELSQHLVTSIRQFGLRNDKGCVWRCEPCLMSDRCDKSCPKCEGTRLVPVEKIPVPDERTYFALTGIGYVEPERRGAGAEVRR